MLVRLASFAAVVGLVAWLAPARTTTITTTTRIVYPPAPVVPILLPMPSIITVEAAAPAGPAVAAHCPAPRTDAPRVTPGAIPGQVTAVTVAPTNAGWIAAWSDTAVYASYDAGATFTEILAGPAAVRAVAFDCFGRALVLRDDRLGIHDPTARAESWRRVPGMTAADLFEPSAAIAAGGPDLVVFGRFGDGDKPHLAVSIDGGASWHQRDLEAYWEGARGATVTEDADRTLRVMFPQPDCMSTALWWGTGRIDADGNVPTFDNGGFKSNGEGATFYGDVAVSAGVTRQIAEDWKPIASLPPNTLSAAIRGALAAVAADDRVFRIVDGRARDQHVAIGATDVQAVDRAGRIWGISCGRPVLLGKDPIEQTCGSDI